jgi:hypothetical protein
MADKDRTVEMFWHPKFGIVVYRLEGGELIRAHIQASEAESQDEQFIRMLKTVVAQTPATNTPYSYVPNVRCSVCGETWDVMVPDGGIESECPECEYPVWVDAP